MSSLRLSDLNKETTYLLTYSSLVYRISLHIHMYVYRPSNLRRIWGAC